jgi:hypothetical protein
VESSTVDHLVVTSVPLRCEPLPSGDNWCEVPEENAVSLGSSSEQANGSSGACATTRAIGSDSEMRTGESMATATTLLNTIGELDQHINLIQAQAGVHVATSSVIPITAGQWNPLYLTHGRLVLDAASEVRLRYISLTHPNWTWSDILTWALSMCIRFQLVIPSRDLELFKPPKTTQSMLDNAVFYNRDVEQPLLYEKDVSIFVLRWRAACANLMKRDHARAFLFQGGIVARLALALGGEDLILSALAGPSPQLTVNELGCTTHIGNQNLRSDSVSSSEIDVLLGRAAAPAAGGSRRSLFPLQSIFDEKIPVYAGQWSQPCEVLFQHLWNHLEIQPVMRTPAEWVKILGPITALGRSLQFAPNPSPQSWESLVQELAGTIEKRWNRNSLQVLPRCQRVVGT